MNGVTVIVPAYNSEQTIKTTLQALLKQEFHDPLQILVIDDCSTDQTADICKSLGLEVERNPVNIGLAASLNQGIMQSKNGIVVTLHPDIVPLSKDWLNQLIAPLSAIDVGASCSVQHPPDCGAKGLTLWEKLLWGRVRPHHALNNKADAYKRDVLERVGMFDGARFRTAGEDEDMALRLRYHRVKVASSSGEVVHNHKFGARSNGRILGKILAKEYSWGKAGGALRRKFPRYRPGAYVYPTPKSALYDGLVRVVLCIGVFIPLLQLICIPGLLASSLGGIRVTARCNIGKGKLPAYTTLNIMRYFAYTMGYLRGIASGRQL